MDSCCLLGEGSAIEPGRLLQGESREHVLQLRWRPQTKGALRGIQVSVWMNKSLLFIISEKLNLLPVLFPSSGVTGMVMNIILPLCPVQCVHLFNSTLSISLLHEAFHLVFYLPRRLITDSCASNIVLRMCPSSLFLTCPYHFSLFCVIFFVTGATFTDPLTSSFLILSFFVTPHIHLSIIHLQSPFFGFFVVDHVLYIFPFSFTGIFRSSYI